MRRGFLYILGLALLVMFVAVAGEVSVQSVTCMACHQQEASFARWMGTMLKAEKRGFAHELIACADCHMEGSPGNTVMSRLRGLLHVVTYLVPQIDPRRPEVSQIFNRTRIPTENCNYCHLGAAKRKAVYLRDLPEELKSIGLAMDHRKHVLSREDTCAKCHERYKQTAPDQADKNVNYAEVNHLACDSCHAQASHSYRARKLLPMSDKQYVEARSEAWKRLSRNPRWMVAIPTEQTCRRCHNGKIHYKTRIFLADCQDGRNFDNCLKCHPTMTKEYFEQHRKKREKSASTASRTGNGSLRRVLAVRSQ